MGQESVPGSRRNRSAVTSPPKHPGDVDTPARRSQTRRMRKSARHHSGLEFTQCLHQLAVLLPLRFQPAFTVDGGLATGCRSGDRLPVSVVVHVAGGEHAHRHFLRVTSLDVLHAHRVDLGAVAEAAKKNKSPFWIVAEYAGSPTNSIPDPGAVQNVERQSAPTHVDTVLRSRR